MRRRVPSKRGGRRAVVSARGGDDAIALDDRPLELRVGREGKRIVVELPYELWVVNASTREVERTIELTAPAPHAFEADDGVLWIGGPHLFRGSMWSGTAAKVGTRLGGFVDRVGLLRPTLLCGVGTGGEVLWDTEKEEALHRRRAGERRVAGLEMAPDGRAVFADASPTAWVIDPDHPSGYMKLGLRRTSEHEVADEAIVAIGRTTEGRCILAARDGAVGWTNRALRLEGEVFPRMDGRRTPLAVTGDARWVYVLRPGGVLQRFLVAQPPGIEDDPEAEPLPDAQTARVERGPTCMALAEDGTLWLAGGTADGQLGRLWSLQPDELEWSELRPGKRRLEQTPTGDESRAPSFVATRNKLEGSPIADLKVDDVISGAVPFLVTHGHGALLERPVASMAQDDVLPGDTILLPAMVRFQEGTARPAILMWEGSPHDDRDVALDWLAWGDEPRGWMALHTPEIRAQGWTRQGVFPLQVALATAPPQVKGHRARVPARWTDADLFSAMARECKKMLKVLW